MKHMERRLRNIEARALANAPEERGPIILQVIGLNPEGYWSIVAEIDEDGNKTPVPPENQVRLAGTSDATAAESFRIRTGSYPKWYAAP